MKEQIIDLKGEMSLLNVLQLQSIDLKAVTDALNKKMQAAGQLLQRSPVIVDCFNLGTAAIELDFLQLKNALVSIGLVPVGIRHLPEESEEKALQSGWFLLRASKNPTKTNVILENVVEEEPPLPARLVVIERPVRSGQQVTCLNGDVVITQHTSAGSEVLASGSIHVYGALRGRALAGVHGDTSARIFCQHLEAELIAIAGRYRLLEELDETLKGEAVMIYLQEDKLRIESL